MINSRELCRILNLKSHFLLVLKIKLNLKKEDYMETDDGSLTIKYDAACKFALKIKKYDAFYYLVGQYPEISY